MAQQQQLDLDTFRTRLEEMRASLKNDLAGLDEQRQNINQTEGYGIKNHPAEDATELQDREQSIAISNVMQRELESIEHALERIEAGAYGICEECKQPIPVERLEARPLATLCIEHQRERDNQVQ
jgi:DnaK suppressor protein